MPPPSSQKSRFFLVDRECLGGSLGASLEMTSTFDTCGRKKVVFGICTIQFVRMPAAQITKTYNT